MTNKIQLIFITFFSIISLAQGEYLDEKNISKKKQTKLGLYINSKEAFELLKKDSNKSLFIDVRTRAEVAFGGMPEIADANIPFKFMNKHYQWDDKSNNFSMTPNPDFVSRVATHLRQKGLNNNDKVFVMCRSGARSAKAVDALSDAGFSQVISIVDGYDGDKAKSGKNKGKRVINGWKNKNLPWSESLDKNKMYMASDLKSKDKQFKMLEKMDLDKNGIVTQDEFEKHHKTMFGNMDENQSNSLDKTEFKNKKKQEKMHNKRI